MCSRTGSQWISAKTVAVVGFEILDASKCLDLDQLRKLDFEEYEYDDPVLVKDHRGQDGRP